MQPRADRERALVDREAGVVVRVLAAGADEGVAAWGVLEIGGEVVAAHERIELGEPVADRLLDEGGRLRVVDDRLVAELIVELGGGSVGCADVVRGRLDELRELLAY